MKRILIFALLLASNAQAQLPKLGTPIDGVVKFFGPQCSIIDTFDSYTTAEGKHLIKTMKFAVVDLGGIKGFVEAEFDRKGHAKRIAWIRRYVQINTLSDDLDFYLPGQGPYGLDHDPREKELGSLHSDGTFEDLDKLKSLFVAAWGKPKKVESDERVFWVFSTPTEVRVASLKRGELVAGVALK